MAVGALADLLDREFIKDPGFRQEIEALWRQGYQTSSVTNVNHGTARVLIQARDMSNVTIN
jgi:hypothetical protein